MGQNLEHGHEGLRERLEFGEVTQRTEQLHRDAGADDEEAHGEDDEAPQLLARPEDFVDKVLQHRRSFD